MSRKKKEKNTDIISEVEQEYAPYTGEVSEEYDEYYDDYYDEYDIGYYEEYDEEYQAYLRYRRRKAFKIIFSIIVVVTAIAVLVQGVMGIVLSNFVLKSGNLLHSEQAADILIAPLSTEEEKQWLAKKVDKIELSSEDGHTLKALRLDNYITAHSYVIICHPVTAHPIDMASYAYHYYDLGFNVILPNMRGCGESDYDSISMGIFDSKDILKWVDMIVAEDSEAQIFLHGLGIGGAAVLMASDEALPKNVKGIIADSSYANLKELFKENSKELYGLPPFPAVDFGGFYAEFVEKWSFDDGNVTENVINAKIPILIFHGGDDNIVPVSHSNELYEALPIEGSDHVLISGAAHCQCLNKNPDKYWRNVDRFILDTIAI